MAVLVVRPIDRIIPACAGNSAVTPSLSQWNPDHPRVCGEQAVARIAVGKQDGSSPRVRGTVRQCSRSRGIRRIIPACAGNSGACVWSSSYSSDHPRVCGEQPDMSETQCSKLGSSPRVRGTDVRPTDSIPYRRIIPACAGNSDATEEH